MKCSCLEDKILKNTKMSEKITSDLKEIKKAMGGWLTLYECLKCETFWEKHYPHSELQGGGEPELHQVDAKYVKEKYGIEPNR